MPPNTDSAAYWVEKLGLQRHPEGGHYREMYRAAGTIPASALPPPFDGARSFATAILFLLEGAGFSGFHRLRSDEVWHFHTGCPLRLHTIDPAGSYTCRLLGADPERGHVFQAAVPAGTWMAADLDEPRTFALVGCTVAPGFDFADFELADRTTLCRRFPQHRVIIEKLIHPPAPRSG